MKVILQRVLKSSVEVNNEIVGSINRGYLLLLGVSDLDTEKDVEVIVDKISKLRIFEDDNGKINLSIGEVMGEVLIVSQFTLYADVKKGNRPSFTKSAEPTYANKLYDYFIEYSKDKFSKVETGIFGENMKVELVNDGPFTLLFDTVEGIIISQ